VEGRGVVVLKSGKAMFEDWRKLLREVKEAFSDVLLDPAVLLFLLASVGLLIILYFASFL